MFPPRPTHHEAAGEPHLVKSDPDNWRAPDERTPFRTCSYCGSIHPEDLLRLLEVGGGALGGSDWKYGWPHKFYVYGPPGYPLQAGPLAGRRIRPTVGKWYNGHLKDEGFDDEARTRLLTALEKHSGIRFAFDEDGRLKYSAPYRGFQADPDAPA